MHGGKIALVYFDAIPPQAATNIASRMGDVLSSATDSMLTLRATALPATEAATKAFTAAVAGKSCVDPSKPDTYAAEAADKTMPLSGYDIVVGLSTVPFCDHPFLMGHADPLYRGRIAQVLLPAMFAGDGSNKNTTNAWAVIAGHEVGHLFREGHAGALAHDGTTLQEAAANGNLALDQYVRSCKYSSFDTNPAELMSNKAVIGSLQPNPLEQEVLRWPNIILEGQRASFVTQLGTEWSKISLGDARTGKFLMTQLPTPVTFEGIDDMDRKTNIDFDMLTLVTQPDAASDVVGVRLVLFESSGPMPRSATLGTLGTRKPGEHAKAWRLSYDGLDIEVELGPDGLRARKLS